MNQQPDIAPDGSPVEVYLRLPPGDEPALIHSAIPEGAEILELGCGTGRITHPLVELGHSVTAVDQSEEMLAHVQGADTVLANVEDLDLGHRFDAVVLASHFINVADRLQRHAFLGTCRRHVRHHGHVLIERYPPDFDWEEQQGSSSELGPVVCTLRDVDLRGRMLRAVMEYRVQGHLWKQPFTAELLSDQQVEGELAAAQLRLERWADDRRSWLVARPIEE